MADWKKNKRKFQMPYDRVERCMRYVKAIEKDEKRAEKARKARFDALLLERWKARHSTPQSARPTAPLKGEPAGAPEVDKHAEI